MSLDAPLPSGDFNSNFKVLMVCWPLVPKQTPFRDLSTFPSNHRIGVLSRFFTLRKLKLQVCVSFYFYHLNIYIDKPYGTFKLILCIIIFCTMLGICLSIIIRHYFAGDKKPQKTMQNVLLFVIVFIEVDRFRNILLEFTPQLCPLYWFCVSS